MTLGTAIDLPVGYYLNNFRQMLDTVTQRYDDLLNTTDTEFVTRFQALNQDAARLLVRLYTRKGPYFRLAKLNYPEIRDLADAAEQLIEAGLVDGAPMMSAGDVGRLLTLPELRQLNWVTQPRRSKAELLTEFDTRDERRTPRSWEIQEPILLPRHWTSLRRLQLMYFGNEQQNLTDFVLSDLGLFQYEDYPLDRSRRWFNQALEIDQQLALNDAKAAFQEAREQNDADRLRALAARLLEPDWCPTVLERANRLRNRLGFRLEQMGDLDTALALFATNDNPPARERRCRILYKQTDYPAAWRELTVMLETARDATEVRFVARFQPRLARKLKRAVRKPEPPPLSECRVNWPQCGDCVEQVACAQLKDAFWLENLLPLGIFGLVHWSWIFADVPGAFHHPFQQGPADLYHPDFLRRRGTDRENLYRSLDRDQARHLLTRHWEDKLGRQNPFVHWSALEKDLVVRCFDAVPWEHWLTMFRHLWLDLRRHRAGFPDLFQFTAQGYRFIEIKGPGDRLQDNQRDWLAVFANAGIPAEVWYVDWAPP